MVRNAEAIEHVARRAVSGERGAFTALYQRLGGDVLRFLVGLRLDLDHQQLEDGLQETFLRLYRLFPNYDPTRPLRPFLLGVARRVALELARQGGVQPLPEPASLGVDSEDPLTVLLESERQDLVLTCLGELRVEHRVALVLRVVNGVTMAELAQALECSVPTARVRLRAAGHALGVALRMRGLGPVTAGEQP